MLVRQLILRGAELTFRKMIMPYLNKDVNAVFVAPLVFLSYLDPATTLPCIMLHDYSRSSLQMPRLLEKKHEMHCRCHIYLL